MGGVEGCRTVLAVWHFTPSRFPAAFALDTLSPPTLQSPRGRISASSSLFAFKPETLSGGGPIWTNLPSATNPQRGQTDRRFMPPFLIPGLEIRSGINLVGDKKVEANWPHSGNTIQMQPPPPPFSHTAIKYSIISSSVPDSSWDQSTDLMTVHGAHGRASRGSQPALPPQALSPSFPSINRGREIYMMGFALCHLCSASPHTSPEGDAPPEEVTLVRSQNVNADREVGWKVLQTFIFHTPGQQQRNRW